MYYLIIFIRLETVPTENFHFNRGWFSNRWENILRYTTRVKIVFSTLRLHPNMVRTRNKSHRSGVPAQSHKSGGAGQSRHEPSHQVEAQPFVHLAPSVHSVHSVHSGRSVHPEQSQRQLDLKDTLNRSRAYISADSREVTYELSRMDGTKVKNTWHVARLKKYYQ